MVLAVLFVLVGLSIGLLGGGGSILAVPLLVYAGGLEAKAAVATSLVVVGFTSAAALVPYARRGLVDVRVAGVFGPVSMLGAFAGGTLAGHLPNTLLLGLFGAVMLAASAAMFRRPRPHSQTPAEPRSVASSPTRALVLALEGGAVGMLTGLVGAGGGFLVVPALVLLAKLEMHRAVGTALVIISLGAFAGVLGHLNHSAIDWRLALALSGTAAAGAVFGGMFSSKLPGARLRRGFAAFVASVAVLLLAAQLSARPVLRESASSHAGETAP